jgi:hypothetical protein
MKSPLPAIYGRKTVGFAGSHQQQQQKSGEQRHHLRRPLRFAIIFSMVIVSCRQWIILSNSTIELPTVGKVIGPQIKMTRHLQNSSFLLHPSTLPSRKWAYAFLVGGARSTRPG